MLLANKAPPLPPRKDSFGRSGIPNRKKNYANPQSITPKQIKNPDADYCSNKASVRRAVCSKKSNANISYTQKLIKPLASVSSTKTIAGIRTIVHQGQKQQFQKRRVSALKLTRARNTSRSFHTEQQAVPLEAPATPQRPVSPACNPVPEIHKASLSIRIAPIPDIKAQPESQQHPPRLSPDTSKMLPNNMQQMSTVRSAQSTECNVVYYVFLSFYLRSFLCHLTLFLFSLLTWL